MTRTGKLKENLIPYLNVRYIIGALEVEAGGGRDHAASGARGVTVVRFL